MNTHKESNDKIISDSKHHTTNASNRVAVTAQITIPPDGGWGWVVVVASFLIFAVGDGTVFTFGSIYHEILKDLKLTPAYTSLISSITLCSCFMCGPIVSAIINRYGFRVCAMAGSAITSMSCCLTFLFGNYIALILFYGLIAGLGFAMLNMPAILAVGFYFLKLRGIAFPCAIAGSSCGIIVLAILYAHMSLMIGWRYTILFQACLTGFAYFVAMAYRPLLSMSVVVTTGEDEEELGSEARLSTIELKSGHGWRRSNADEYGLKLLRSNQQFPTAAEIIDNMSRPTSKTDMSTTSLQRLSLIAMIPNNKHAEYHEHELERVRSLLDEIEEEDEVVEELKAESKGAKFDQFVESDKGKTIDTVKEDNAKEKDSQKEKSDQIIVEDTKKNDQETKIETTSKANEDDDGKIKLSRELKVEFRVKKESTEELQTLKARKSKDDSMILLDSKRTSKASLRLDDITRSKSLLFNKRRSQRESSMQLNGRRSKSILLDRKRSRIESTSGLQRRTRSVLFDKDRRESVIKDIMHWEQHVPESRPMYRDDAFFNNTKRVLTASHEELAENPIEYQLRMSRVATKEDLKERKGMFTTAFTRVLFTMLDPHLLKRKSCLCVCLSMMFFYAAFLIPIIFVPDRGLGFGIPYRYTEWFLSAIGLAALFGRFIGSAIALRVHPVHLLCAMYTIAGAATIFSIIWTTADLQFLYCAIFGLTTCGTNSMRTVIFARLYGLEKLTNCTGLAYLFQGIGCLISPPCAGILKEVWHQSHFLFSGACFFCSAALFLPVLSLVEKEKRLIEQSGSH